MSNESSNEDADKLIQEIKNDPAKVVRHIDYALVYLGENGLEKTLQEFGVEKEYPCLEELEHSLCQLKLLIIEIHK